MVFRHQAHMAERKTPFSRRRSCSRVTAIGERHILAAWSKEAHFFFRSWRVLQKSAKEGSFSRAALAAQPKGEK